MDWFKSSAVARSVEMSFVVMTMTRVAGSCTPAKRHVEPPTRDSQTKDGAEPNEEATSIELLGTEAELV
jgi:hypothetical protein